MSNETWTIESAESNLRRAANHLAAYREQEDDAYQRGFDDGRKSMEGVPKRSMTGAQFIARLMNCVSPDTAGWAELHRLSQSGFGRNIEVTEDES